MKDQTYWPEMARRSEKCAGPVLMLRAVMRKSALIYMTVIRQRVASLILDCNGVFAIKAYSQFFLSGRKFQVIFNRNFHSKELFSFEMKSTDNT